MSDTAERLRGIAADYAHLSTIYPVAAEVIDQDEVDVIVAAADEIDLLRAALKAAEEGLREAGAIYGADAARAALGEAG